MGIWFYQLMGETEGPVSDEELKQLAKDGIIESATYIRHGTGGEWVTADHVKGLFHQDPPASEPPEHVQHEKSRPQLDIELAPPEQRHPMMCWIIKAWEVIAVVILIAGSILSVVVVLIGTPSEGADEVVALGVALEAGWIVFWDSVTAAGLCYILASFGRLLLSIETNTLASSKAAMVALRQIDQMLNNEHK